jgi:hypothetical protein
MEVAETVKETAGNGNGRWRNNVWWWLNVEWKCLWDVSDMRGKTVSLDWIIYYDSIQGFYTTLWVPYESVLFAYFQREWKDRHTKIRQRGIKGIEDKGNEGNRYMLGTFAGPGLLSWADPLCVTSIMLIWSRPCRSVCWSLFSLHGSQLGLFFFGLPPCPSAFPTQSISIQIFVTDYRNSAGRC